MPPHAVASDELHHEPARARQISIDSGDGFEVRAPDRGSRSIASTFLDEDELPQTLQGRKLVIFVSCAWGGTLIGNVLCAYPAVFSYTIQQHLDISSSAVGLFLSVPSLLAFIVNLGSPVIIDAYGLQRVLPGASLVILLAIGIVNSGFAARSFWIMLPAYCVVKPLLGMVATCNLSLLGTCVEKEKFASLAGLGTAVVTMGYTLAHYTLPLLHADNVLPTLLGLTMLMAAMNTYAASVCPRHLGGPRSASANLLNSQGRVALQHEVQRKLSLSAIYAFPWKYWLVLLIAAFKASFNSFVDFQPYAFQRCNGLDEHLSNQIVGSVSICVIIFAPLAGCIFSNFKDSHGPLFIMAAVLLLSARTVAAVDFSVRLAWYEMITTGIGQAFLSAGCVGLLPEVLAGRQELLTSGNSYIAFTGQLFCTVTIQVCFSIFTAREERVGKLIVTPGQFFMVAQGTAVLILAIALHRASPLAPQDYESMKDVDEMHLNSGMPSESTAAESGDIALSDSEPLAGSTQLLE